jgi:hypothetical protein
MPAEINQFDWPGRLDFRLISRQDALDCVPVPVPDSEKDLRSPYPWRAIQVAGVGGRAGATTRPLPAAGISLGLSA